NYALTVTVAASAPVGVLRQQITLVTDDQSSPHVPLLVEGRVEEDITVATPIVSLGTLTPGTDKTVRVVLRGRKPFTIESVECETDRECFKVRLPRAASTVHVLPLTVIPPSEPGPFTEQFTVTIAGRNEPITFRAQGRIVQ
ncbi:MAG: DUF1573 domain-containing protein, partial [Planctomycetaceae bacterium]